ncbi:hypothetical protein ANO11243_063290 [Dothideomycetidae sp. 11243]|nr:hypothetical protein ANO11243_063290 [fungal sp. No.11243]
MATFAKKSFNAASYAAARPTYPSKLYEIILKYHRGPKEQCLDLGCGHGVVARQFGSNFSKFLGTDPSEGMIEQARKLTPKTEYPFADFRAGFAEDDVPLPSGSIDMVTAAQACHWFDQSRLFPLLRDKVRQGGTLAFWGYKDHAFVDYPKSTAILDSYTYGDDKDTMGPYWPKGRDILHDQLRAVRPPENDWEDIQRIEYEPGKKGKNSGEGTLLLGKRMKVGECKEYMRTWSSFHGWQETHPGAVARSKGGEGDVVDEVFDKMSKEDEIMGNEDSEIEVEWGSAIILARRK